MNNRRSNIDIIADILRLGEASKTQVMYGVSMSYTQLQKYLDYLVEGGFLDKEKHRANGGFYRITGRGRELLQAIEEIGDILTLSEAADAMQTVKSKQPAFFHASTCDARPVAVAAIPQLRDSRRLSMFAAAA